MEKAKKLLLEKTLPFYKNFRARGRTTAACSARRPGQWFRVAYIEETLAGEQARPSYEQARDRACAA